MNWVTPEWMVQWQEQEIPAKKRRVVVHKPERFVWVCKRREVARNLLALIDASSGEGKVLPRYPKQVHGEWAGPRWVVVAWGLTPQEFHMLQRIAPKLDPSARDWVWDETMNNGHQTMPGGYTRRTR